MRLVGAPKVTQYTDGLAQVASAARAGKIDQLYRGVSGES